MSKESDEQFEIDSLVSITTKNGTPLMISASHARMTWQEFQETTEILRPKKLEDRRRRQLSFNRNNFAFSHQLLAVVFVPCLVILGMQNISFARQAVSLKQARMEVRQQLQQARTIQSGRIVASGALR